MEMSGRRKNFGRRPQSDRKKKTEREDTVFPHDIHGDIHGAAEGRILLFFGKLRKSERDGEMWILPPPAAGRNGKRKSPAPE